jgi:flagellar basal-body rod protein FlgF
VVASTPGTLTTPGPLDNTSRPLDVAVGDQGWLAVQLPNGQEAYTRNGNIQEDNTGQLLVEGYPVVGQNGPIVVPTQASITMATDGTVSALGEGDQPNTVEAVGQLKLVKPAPGQLERGDDGLFHLTAAATAQVGQDLPADNTIKVMPGELEGSNVNTAQALVDMIGTARRFEMQMKVISDSDGNAEKANELLTVSS